MGPFQSCQGRGDQSRADGRAGGDTNCLCQMHPSASNLSLCSSSSPLQQNQAPAADPFICDGSVPLHQLHSSALAPSLSTGSTLLPQIHPATMDPSHCLRSILLHQSIPRPELPFFSHNTLLGVGAEPWGPAQEICPLPSHHSIPRDHTPTSNPCTKLGQFSCPCTSGQLPPRPQGMSCKDGGGS